MSPDRAKKIGSITALKFMTLGLLLAFLIMSILGGALVWITDFYYVINVLIGVVLSYIIAFFVGRIAGVRILVKKNDPERIGGFSGLTILFLISISVGWTGFFQEGIDNVGSIDDPFYDYIFKPFFWIFVVGLIPSIILGIIFGNRIKNLGKNITQQWP